MRGPLTCQTVCGALSIFHLSTKHEYGGHAKSATVHSHASLSVRASMSRESLDEEFDGDAWKRMQSQWDEEEGNDSNDIVSSPGV